MSRKISDFFLKAVAAAKEESGIARSSLQKIASSPKKASDKNSEEISKERGVVEACGDKIEKVVFNSESLGIVLKDKTVGNCDTTSKEITSSALEELGNKASNKATEPLVQETTVGNCGGNKTASSNDLPSTSEMTDKLISEVHVETTTFNKENETLHNIVDVKKRVVGDVEMKDINKQTKCVNFIDIKKSFRVETPSVVAVIPTKEGTFNHLLSLLVDRSWRRVLSIELRKEYMHNIVMYLEKEKAKGVTVFPPRELIFNAFNLTPINQIRVVLIGQDPYHGIGQAHGLCFSVNKGVRPPPSLVNMYKELKTDIPSFRIPDHGCLASWARQGVFMLNATLTVEAHKANSHSHIGWQKFTDEVIRIISRETKGVVFLLWGGFAHKKEVLVDRKKHTVIKTAHPSPLSARMFFGCRCFSRTNEALSRMGRPPIDWKAL